MSTNATIGILYPDGTITSTTVHWDGYPSHTGRILLEGYKTTKRVEELLSFGELSSIGLNIRPEFPDHSYEKPEKDCCVFYGRDRGEEDVDQPSKYDDISQWYKEGLGGYRYLFVDDEWRLVQAVGNSRLVGVQQFYARTLNWEDMND